MRASSQMLNTAHTRSEQPPGLHNKTLFYMIWELAVFFQSSEIVGQGYRLSVSDMETWGKQRLTL